MVRLEMKAALFAPLVPGSEKALYIALQAVH